MKLVKQYEEILNIQYKKIISIAGKQGQILKQFK